MAGGGLGLSRTVRPTALKPLGSGTIGQGATPTPHKTIHVDAYTTLAKCYVYACIHTRHTMAYYFYFYRTSQLI